METSTTALTTKHETPWTGDEPQRNAKNTYLCATPLGYAIVPIPNFEIRTFEVTIKTPPSFISSGN